MQAQQASSIARVGGLLLLVSLAIPYFELSFSGVLSVDFRLHELDRTAVIAIAVGALIALAQPRFSVRKTRSMVYLALSAVLLIGLLYRLWIVPPESMKIGDLLGGIGDFKVSGQEIEFGDLSVGELLGAVGGSFDPTFGAWMATLGGFLFALGALLEFRAADDTPVSAPPLDTFSYSQLDAPRAQAPPATTYPGQNPPAPGFSPQPPQPPQGYPGQAAPAQAPPPDPGAPQRPPGS